MSSLDGCLATVILARDVTPYTHRVLKMRCMPLLIVHSVCVVPGGSHRSEFLTTFQIHVDDRMLSFVCVLVVYVCSLLGAVAVPSMSLSNCRQRNIYLHTSWFRPWGDLCLKKQEA
jgi:hypothetical protein